MTAKVYIAGPMTGYVEHNFPAFRAAAKHLREKGYEVLSPAELDDPRLSHEELRAIPHHVYMKRDIKVLVTCDLIYLLPGWTHSKGACLEATVARGCGIDELRPADIELWRTFEGEPEETVLDVDSDDFLEDEGDLSGDELRDAEIEALDRLATTLVTPTVLPVLMSAGRRVVLVDREPGSKWDGFEAEVVRTPDHADAMVDLRPLSPRPDGHGRAEFTWERKDVILLAEPLTRHSSHRPGDRFPNVAYVRDMTGVTARELAENARRLAQVGGSVDELFDGRGAE